MDDLAGEDDLEEEDDLAFDDFLQFSTSAVPAKEDIFLPGNPSVLLSSLMARAGP